MALDPIVKIWLLAGMVLGSLYFPYVFLCLFRKHRSWRTGPKYPFPWVTLIFYTGYTLFFAYSLGFPKKLTQYEQALTYEGGIVPRKLESYRFNFLAPKSRWESFVEREPVVALILVHQRQKEYHQLNGVYAGGEDVFIHLNWLPNLWQHAFYCGTRLLDIGCENCQKSHEIKIPVDENWPFSVRPGADREHFTCMAIGNWDSDPYYDIWSVNETGTITHHASEDFNLDYTGIYLKSFGPDETWYNSDPFFLGNFREPFGSNYRVTRDILIEHASFNIHSISLGLSPILLLLIARQELKWRRRHRQGNDPSRASEANLNMT